MDPSYSLGIKMEPLPELKSEQGKRLHDPCIEPFLFTRNGHIN